MFIAPPPPPTLATWSQSALDAACDCSFLFFARPLLPTLLRHAASSPQPRLLPSLMAAYRDVAPKLRLGGKLGGRPASCAGGWVHAYQDFLLKALENELIAPLCLSAETDLRLTNHATQVLLPLSLWVLLPLSLWVLLPLSLWVLLPLSLWVLMPLPNHATRDAGVGAGPRAEAQGAQRARADAARGARAAAAAVGPPARPSPPRLAPPRPRLLQPLDGRAPRLAGASTPP